MLARIMQFTDRITGHDIPPSDRISLVRARLLTFCPPVFGLFGVILVSLYAQSPDSTAPMIAVAGAVSVILISTPIILWATKSLGLVGWITLLGCCAALFPEPLIDLGFREPEMSIIVLLPVLAGLLISRQGASITYFLVTAMMLAVLVKLLNWPPGALAAVPAEEHIRFFFFNFAATTSAYLVSLCFVWLFQSSLRDVQAAMAEAETASEAKTVFLANMSHELRTPINGILGFSKLALNGNIGNDERNWVSTIQKSGDTLLSIVNDILDLSKLEAGALTIDRVEFDLGEILDQVLTLNSQAAAEKGLHLGAVADAALPSIVEGDPGRLRQVLTNLISNAIKFTDEGGIILNISSRAVEGKQCELRFEVVDTGIGIPEDKLPFLFDRFTQVDASPARRFGGAGLGLAICKDLVELMDGTLGVQSVHKRGSVFWFSLQLPVRGANLNNSYAIPPALRDRAVLIAGQGGIDQTIVERQLQVHGIPYRFSDYGPDLHQQLSDENIAAAFLLNPPADMAENTVADGVTEADAKIIEVSKNPLSRSALSGNRKADLLLPAPLGHNLVLDALVQVFRETSEVVTSAPEISFDGTAAGRILLAEDNVSNQLLFQTLLVKAGYTVDTVTNGFDAIKAIRHQTYDLVLMDGQMPEMGGVEAARKIRNEGGPNAAIPIIALTANTMSGDREQYLNAGMNDYLAKPIDFDVFFEKVAQWVERKPVLETS